MASNNPNKNKTNVELASKIFFEYSDFIHSVIHTKVNNQEIEEDMIQDLFLVLVRKPIPADVKNKRSYLYKTIINDITDFRRRSEVYITYFKNFEKKMDSAINKSTPENAYINEEQIIKMLKLIKEQLPVSCSRAIILHYVENMNIHEVAKEMNVRTASVSRYIHKGLKKLRRLWKLK